LSTEQQADVKRRSSRAAREGRRRRRARPEAAATTAVPSIDQAAAAAETALGKPEPRQSSPSRSEARRQAKAESVKSQRRGIISSERTEGIRRFLRETRAEIDKVVWPDRETTMNLTLLVIGLSVALGILLGGIDFVLYRLFEAF
jgi:preprotein translocase subunit SecE